MTNREKVLDLSTAWEQAALVFPHFHRCGVDWDGAYGEFLDRVTGTRTEREHALLLAEFVNLLGDGHTDFSFSTLLLDEAGYIPFELTWTDEGYCVQGSRILAIDGRALAELLQQAERYVYHVEGYIPRLRYILPFLLEPGEHTMETERGRVCFTMAVQRPAASPRELTITRYGEILCVRFDDMLHDWAPQIRQALLEFRPRTVILDIRENIGGMTKLAADIARLFISGAFSGCQKWTRSMTGVDYASASQILSMPDMDPVETGHARRLLGRAEFEAYTDLWSEEGAEALFTGPVALLTSRKTMSAAEDFTAFFRSNGRAAIIGAPTCGTSGTPLLRRLTCGTLRVCSVGYRLLDGTEWIGRGIQPDVVVPIGAEDLREGRDPALERAFEFLR